MCKVPTMTRLKENIRQAVELYADEHKWTVSQAVAEIVSESCVLAKYISRLEKNKDAA